MKKLKKTASFTDIHWGCKGNSEQHNQDCINYIDWFCEQVKQDPTIDNIVFGGDWFETRSALNIMTMNYSYRGAKKLNDLGLPVFFIIGNHDLYHRHTRELYSTINFHEFNNFQIINEPTLIPNLGNGALLCPYLFHDEYPTLAKYLTTPVWWGHFEFKGFVITGYNVLMPHGPDPDDFKGPKRIFSGHFHKRQQNRNIVYIGNTFPTNYSDAGDSERGMAVYEYSTDNLVFTDWKDCPKYTKTLLSNILDNTITINPHSRVKCVVDIPITFEESNYLRQKYLTDFSLRDFTMEESQVLSDAITETTASPTVPTELSSVNDLVIQMLNDISSDKLDNQTLINIYRDLR